MKKNIVKVFLVSLFCGTFFSACDVLDQEFYEGRGAEVVFTNPEDIRLARIGLYDWMQHQEFLGGRAQMYVDVRSMDTNPSTWFGAISTMSGLTSANAMVTAAWTTAYQTIGAMNHFIENMERVTSDILPEAERRQFIAEARFLRAVTYFYVLNLWGQKYVADGTGLGVPLVLRSFDAVSAFLPEEAHIPRATIAEVYAQIEKDLREAIPHLLVTHPTAWRTRALATRGAAYAFLSRVYLYQRKWDDVIRVANSPYMARFSLDADFRLIFPIGTSAANAPVNSNEVIFFIAHDFGDNPNTNHALGQHYGRTRRADITISANYVALLEPEDRRRTILLETNPAGTTFFTTKFPNGADGWAPVIRYAEVLLNRAEALAQTFVNVGDANFNEALAIVNQIRARAGASVIDAASVIPVPTTREELIDLILEERRRELAFEGHGSFDLFRNGRGIPAGRGGAAVPAMPFPNNMFALPIPHADVSKAPDVLIQNPGF